MPGPEDPPLVTLLRFRNLDEETSRLLHAWAQEHPKVAGNIGGEMSLRLLVWVRENPGRPVVAARNAMGVSNGTIYFHIDRLEGARLIRREKRGRTSLLCPAGFPPQASPLQPTARSVLEAIHRGHGRSTATLQAATKLSSRILYYHVAMLRKAGLVVSERSRGLLNLALTEEAHALRRRVGGRGGDAQSASREARA
ncbi:MAG: hypothetical protein QOE90_1490 [Thermoplasmata archaeon]|jgi:DNA-binding MarR family transcriptional regulator|nr:hypothetical protein [Thermoplasmata archaeon]